MILLLRPVLTSRRTGHSFFDSQPVQNADVFFMRMILHDWSDAYCHKILSQLRAVAQPHTRLVVIDNIVSYACDAGKGSQSEYSINGAVVRDSKADMPAPLLANKGEAGVVSYLADLTVCLDLWLKHNHRVLTTS